MLLCLLCHCNSGKVTPATSNSTAATTPTSSTGSTTTTTTNPNIDDTPTAATQANANDYLTLSDAPAVGTHVFRFVNNCKQTIWVGALNGKSEYTLPEQGGWEMPSLSNHNITIVGAWSGRFWGRTECTTQNETFTCATGDCVGLQCQGRGGQPTTLAEFTLSPGTEQDFYDVSNVDAFSIPTGIYPALNALISTASGGTGACKASYCAGDINAVCPEQFQVKNSQGKIVACYSECTVTQSDLACCKNANDKPETCPATESSKIFKSVCPQAYSYAYDDLTSTFTCATTGYTIVFCPPA